MKKAHLASEKISSEESIKLEKVLFPLIEQYGIMEVRKEIDFCITLIKMRKFNDRIMFEGKKIK